MKYLVVFFILFKALACDISFQTLPLVLSETCLYQNIVEKKLNSQIYTFKPQYELWTDGAQKNRWVYLPQGTKIDSNDPDLWNFPVGTIFWKEFSKKGLRLETRILKKINNSKNGGWIFGTYQWDEHESEAKLIEFGLSNSRGTDHSIPGKTDCQFCHGFYTRENNTWLKDIAPQGFDAISLAQTGEKIPECDTYQNPNPVLDNQAIKIDLDELIIKNKLTQTHGWQQVKPIIVGNKLQQEALGYLHYNCSSCHNPNGQVSGLGLNLKNKTVHDWQQLPVYLSAFNIPTRMYRTSENFMRISPQDIEKSAVWVRTNSENLGERMPKIGSKIRDPYGVCILKNWINQL